MKFFILYDTDKNELEPTYLFKSHKAAKFMLDTQDMYPGSTKKPRKIREVVVEFKSKL